MSRDKGTYQAYVVAGDAEEAIAIAAEALPADSEMIEHSAEPSPGVGPDSRFHVTIRFRRTRPAKGEY